jgi:hypothetical protein
MSGGNSIISETFQTTSKPGVFILDDKIYRPHPQPLSQRARGEFLLIIDLLLYDSKFPIIGGFRGLIDNLWYFSNNL